MYGASSPKVEVNFQVPNSVIMRKCILSTIDLLRTCAMVPSNMIVDRSG